MLSKGSGWKTIVILAEVNAARRVGKGFWVIMIVTGHMNMTHDVGILLSLRLSTRHGTARTDKNQTDDGR